LEFSLLSRGLISKYLILVGITEFPELEIISSLVFVYVINAFCPRSASLAAEINLFDPNFSDSYNSTVISPFCSTSGNIGALSFCKKGFRNK